MVTLLQGCAGYAVYEKSRWDNDDEVSEKVIQEVTGKPYNYDNSFYTNKISKQDVISVLGVPDKKGVFQYDKQYDHSVTPSILVSYKEGELWSYKKSISFYGFIPIIIVPIPLLWWPSGFHYSYVYFEGDYVTRITYDSNEADLKCLIVLLFPYCIKTLDFH